MERGTGAVDLKRIEFIYEDPDFPVPSDNPVVAVEQRKGG